MGQWHHGAWTGRWPLRWPSRWALARYRAAGRPRRDRAAVLTANLLAGRALAGAVAGLARRKHTDALSVQELSDDAEAGLQQAGLGDLLPYRATQLVPYGTRGSIYPRYPLRGGPPAVPSSAARCTARLDLPSGQFVHLACIHAAPPRPPRSPGATARWRSQLSALPAPGDSPLMVAGDFNATLDHGEFRRLLRPGYADAASQADNGLSPTWGPQPGRRPALLATDHVLTDRRCAVLSTSAHLLPGSDHRALYAELRLPRPAAGETKRPRPPGDRHGQPSPGPWLQALLNRDCPGANLRTGQAEHRQLDARFGIAPEPPSGTDSWLAISGWHLGPRDRYVLWLRPAALGGRLYAAVNVGGAGHCLRAAATPLPGWRAGSVLIGRRPGSRGWPGRLR
jgi:endonuclease/exonuclease/phosphatase (EEP) superfamily protein YafD